MHIYSDNKHLQLKLDNDLHYSDIVLFLQSQLDIPFKVRAGHIGEILDTVPIWQLVFVTEEHFLTLYLFR